MSPLPRGNTVDVSMTVHAAIKISHRKQLKSAVLHQLLGQERVLPGLLQKLFGLGIPALSAIQIRQFVDAVECIRVLVAQDRAAKFQGLEKNRLGFYMTALVAI